MTVDDVKKQMNELKAKEMLVIVMDEQGHLHMNHSDMPVPLLCMFKEVMSLSVTKAMMPKAVPPRPALVTPLNQPL